MGYYSPHSSNCGLFVKKMQIRRDVALCFAILNNKTFSTLKSVIQAIQAYFSFTHNKTTCDKKIVDCLQAYDIADFQPVGGS